MSFARQLSVEIDAVEDDLNRTWQISVAQAFNEVVQMTPVGNPDLWQSPAPPGYVGGTARASWLAASNVDERIGTDDLNLRPGDVVRVGGRFVLYSNLPYMEALEDGWSQQAPGGMVSLVQAKWDDIVRSNSR